MKDILQNFSEYFDLPDERLKQFIPNYTYELVDLNKIPDDCMLKLSVGHYLKSTFLVFKDKDDKDFLYQFQEGKEQGMKIKEAIISLRSLLLIFPLYPNFSLSRITKIAAVKEGTVKEFYKELVSLDSSRIKKAALALLFKKITLAKADEKEIDLLIKDFLRNNSKSSPS